MFTNMKYSNYLKQRGVWKKYFYFKTLILLLMSSLLLVSCSKNLEKNGYSFGDLGDTEQKISAIKPGKTNEIEVLKSLGSPSSMSNFGEDTFYYMQRLTERKAFFRPKLVNQRIVTITFDENHVVKAVNHYDINHSQKLIYDRETTVIKGNEMKVIEQLVRNFGRFNVRNPQKVGK